MSDVLVSKVEPSMDEEPIYIPNVYNAPVGSKQAGDSAEIVMGYIGLLRKRAFIMGEVNLHHTDWDNRTFNSTAQGKRFAGYVADNNAVYELELGIVMHTRGGTLDLVIFSNSI